MVVVAGIGTLLFTRTVNEIKHSGDDAAIVQTLLLARGGANLGGALLTSDIRDELNDIVKVRSSTTTCWSFGSGSCTAGQPDSASVVSDLTGSNSVASQLQARIDTLLCGADPTSFGAGTEVRIRVYVTNQTCGEALPSGITLPSGRFVTGKPRPENQDYAIPFVMVSEATLGTFKRNVVMQGEYRFTVGRVTFAQYALFTNFHTGASGDAVWFTDNTLFDGPVHTNEYFRFYNNPWFGHKVTSAGCPSNQRGTRTNPSTGVKEEYCKSANYGAYFYDKTTTLRKNLGPNPSYGGHAPELTGGVDWQAEYIPLPTNSFVQSDEAKAAGIHFGDGVSLNSLEIWAGAANGSKMSCNNSTGACSPKALYQYIEAAYCTNGRRSDGTCRSGGTTTVTYRFDEAGVLQKKSGNNWIAATNSSGAPILNFNGVIYADGDVDRFGGPARPSGQADNPKSAPPAVASFAQMTIAVEGTLTLTRDVKYEDAPCSSAPTRQANGTVTTANCENQDAVNVLGVYTQKGNIVIGNNNSDSKDNAPKDVNIHGVLMSSQGMVTVEDYDKGSPRGAVNLLGGIIENQYGAFGTFNASTGKSSTGYNRVFTYDPRMYATVSPPYFPTIGLDKVKGVMVYSFGQREQVY
ncbi:MAG: DUF4900 domain-containing protein [Trueperaceae bacterium]|nr:DUF4900 domain-containing protein [Trueperaceae bacterium]